MSDNYHDSEGRKVSLDILCVREPAWAANRIRAGLVEIEKLGRAMHDSARIVNEVITERDALKAEMGRLATHCRIADATLSADNGIIKKHKVEVERLIRLVERLDDGSNDIPLRLKTARAALAATEEP